MIERFVLGGLAALLMTAPASARIEQWATYAAGAETTMTDCRDCEEDIGILVLCKGANQPAELMVMFQAQENIPQEGNAAQRAEPLFFTIDGQTFEYTPSYEFFGLVGHVPKVDLYRDDLMVEALQAGQSVNIFHRGGSVQISLNGSRAAFSGFSQSCPWAARTGISGQQQRNQSQGGQPRIGAPQIGAPQIGQPQIGAPQIGAPQIGTPQIGNQTQGAQPRIARPQIGQSERPASPSQPSGNISSGPQPTLRPQIVPPQIGNQTQGAQPQIGQPQIGRPQISAPQINTTDPTQPLGGQRRTAQPRIGQPQIGQPQTGRPQIENAPSQPVDTTFPQAQVAMPFTTRSGGGRVRGAPSLDAVQVGSTREMDPIVLLEEVPGSMMNGYPWFRIRYSGGEGFQWGGIVCRPPGSALQGTYGECTR